MFFREFLYYLYENRLLSEVKKGDLPRHVGLILDGNRRFAQVKGLEKSDGHQVGADKIDDVLHWCEELSIPIITLWALSTENLERNPDELGRLLAIIENKITALTIDDTTHRRRMRIRALGQVEKLPASTQNVLKLAEEATAQYGDSQLNIAIGYGGRQEIIDAFKRLLAEKASENVAIDQIIQTMDSEDIRRHLYTVDLPDPDLIIRTSGEVRMSGFLLWQSAYSEYYFCDAFWPDFRRIDFLRAIRSYQARKRRFGK